MHRHGEAKRFSGLKVDDEFEYIMAARHRPGTISLSSSTHLPFIEASLDFSSFVRSFSEGRRAHSISQPTFLSVRQAKSGPEKE
jgi:hypothetical protein